MLHKYTMLLLITPMTMATAGAVARAIPCKPPPRKDHCPRDPTCSGCQLSSSCRCLWTKHSSSASRCPVPCNPAAEVALKPPIRCFESSSSHALSCPSERFFSQRPGRSCSVRFVSASGSGQCQNSTVRFGSVRPIRFGFLFLPVIRRCMFHERVTPYPVKDQSVQITGISLPARQGVETAV